MAGMSFSRFSGIRPRIPDSLLGEFEASQSQNCDFAYVELRNTKDGFLLRAMSNTVRGIFTDDGTSFYTWDKDIDAVVSPVASDPYGRMYYSGDNGIRFATRSGTQVSGGPPGTSYLVGVPRPTRAPTLTAKPPLGLVPTGATAVFTFHWEYGGVKYQETVISPSSSTDKTAAFPAPPEKAASTPEMAFAVLRATVNRSDGSLFLDLYTNNSSYASTNGIYMLDIKANGTDPETYTVSLRVAIKEEDKETRAYVYTYVNTYGEESAPSNPALVTTAPIIDVDVTTFKDAISNYAPLKEIRIYRTPSGQNAVAEYFFVGSVSILSGSPSVFTDNVKGEMLNEALTTIDVAPPITSLTGLMALPNGILAAWSGNDLHFSEPYRPWSWPGRYVKALPHRIVGGIAHGSGAIITTTVDSYLVSGVSSDGMSLSKTNIDQGGVSKWAIAVVDGYVIYGCNDGLVVINGGAGSLIQSQRFFTREVWRQRYGNGLATMRFAAWDGRLVVYSSAGAFTPFMIRLDEADGTMTELPGLVAACSFVSPLADQFYYANGVSLYQFNGGAAQTVTWTSREIVMPRPVNFGAAQAVCEGNWTLEILADEVVKHTQAISTGVSNFRLPAGFEADRYKIRLTGSGRFRELRIAQSFRELAQR